MKRGLIILFCFIGITAAGQSKTTIKVLANTRLLENTVFGTKDSATLEKLFATSLSYVHSSGKIESREEAIRGIVNNRSRYTKTGSGLYSVSEQVDSMVVNQEYRATEKKEDGTESALNLSIELVWIKEKGDWKLARRQATKIE